MADDFTPTFPPLPPEDRLAAVAAALITLRLNNADRVTLIAAEDRLCTLLADIRRRAPADAIRLAGGLVSATHARAVTDRSDNPVLMIVAGIDPAALMWPIREMLARKRPARCGSGGTFSTKIGDHQFTLHNAYYSFAHSVREDFSGGLITRDGRPFCYVAMHDTHGDGVFFVYGDKPDDAVDVGDIEKAFGRPSPFSVFDLFLSLAVPYFRQKVLVRHLLRRVLYTDGAVLYQQRVRADEMANAIAALRADGYQDDAIVNSVYARDGWSAALQLFDSFTWIFSVPLEPAEIREALDAGMDLPPHLRRIAEGDRGSHGCGDGLLQ
jgi:hypothetical protein